MKLLSYSVIGFREESSVLPGSLVLLTFCFLFKIFRKFDLWEDAVSSYSLTFLSAYQDSAQKQKVLQLNLESKPISSEVLLPTYFTAGLVFLELSI